MASVEAADGEETGVEDLQTIVEYKFRQLLEYLQREEIALKALRAVDLKSCLRTGAGTKGHAPDAERMKFYRMLNKISKDLTPEQKQELAKWEQEICGDGVALRPAVDKDFDRLLEILEKRRTDLQNLGKASLQECFMTNQSNQDKEFKFCQNFFSRKAASLSEEQKQELAKWEQEICSDGVALRPAVDKDFNHLLEILEKRKTELQNLGKASLQECFMTNQSNQDKDFKFCQNFFSRKAASLSEEQKQELAKWEQEICSDGVALRPAVDKDFNHLLEILEKRKTELQNLGKESLQECFTTNQSNKNKDFKFCQIFFSRKAASLSEKQKQELAKWEQEICGDGVALRPAVDKDFDRLLEILEKRRTDLQNLEKASLQECFTSKQSNLDKDFKFCKNSFGRKAASLTEEQKQELAKWEQEICGDGVALRPAVDKDFNHLIEILEKRKTDLQNLEKASLQECFTSKQSNLDKDFKFCKNFFGRKAASLTEEQKQELAKWEQEICGDGVALRPAVDKDFDRLLEILQKRKTDLQNLGKASLQECFTSNQSNLDKDFKFCKIFFGRKAASLSENQKQTLTEFEVEICQTVNFDDFNRFVSILQDRAEELAILRYADFTALLSCRKLKDQDFKFCATFWRRNASRLNNAEKQQLEELQAGILRPTADFDRVALRPAVSRALDKFLNILDRRHAEFLAVGASSVTSLFSRHAKKQDSEVRACYWFVSRIFPRLNEIQQQRVRGRLNDLLTSGNTVPRKPKYAAKLHDEETVLGDALPRSRLPKSLRQLYGNSMDAESRVMTFFNRAHEVDRHMMSLEFQDCDYCKEGWFGTRIKRQDLPGGFEPEAYKKTNFLQAAQTQWLDPNRPICENCLLEAKRRAAEGMPKEPLRFTAANYADPGDTLPETDALTFFEEEILSPIQHIVRIFTLHSTGQCELRGHVGNLFQNGPQYVRNIPAAIGDMKMLLIRRCPKDPNRKQRIPFLVSRRRLERALDRVFKPLSEGGSQAMQPGALTTGGFVEFVNRDNLQQFADNEEGEEPPGLQVQVVEQIPWERIEHKLFAMWVSCNLELQMAAEVRLLHETQEDAENASKSVGMSLRTAERIGHVTDGAGMSLRTAAEVQLATESVGMSLRTAAQNGPSSGSDGIAENESERVGMSLRTAEQMGHVTEGLGMSLRTAEQVQVAKESVGTSLRTADDPPLPEAARVEKIWTNLRAGMEEKFPGDVGGKDYLEFSTLASYLSSHLRNKTAAEVENILHDEFTAVQELASWEEPLVSEGLWSPEDLAGQPTEEELKEDLWDAVCKANESSSSKSSIRRFGAARVKGVPILDPPTVSSRNQLIREDQPYYIVAGFIKLFPLGLGDYWAHLQQRQEETREPLSFWEWIKHLLLRSDGRFQCHPRFYFFALNTALRNKALRARGDFLKRQQTAGANNVAYTTEVLFKMGKAQFTKIVSAFEHSMAGSAQEKLRQRSDLEAMVEQIEQETLEEQGHALLHSWQEAITVGDMLQEKGFLKLFREVKNVCNAAKPAIDKVLSPETIAVAPKPNIVRVDVPSTPCVFADHDAVSLPSRVFADREIDPAASSSRVFADRDAAALPSHIPAGHENTSSSSRVFADRDAASSSSRVFADRNVASSSSRVFADRDAASSSSRVFADRDVASSSSRVFADRDIASSPSCVFADHDIASASYENQTGEKRSVQDVVTEVEQRSLCVQGGGEIPCHFSTLTTAIYHWDDLAKCLDKYERAVKSRRGGRSDPLEPSERKLSEVRRRVLRYPGVVAWFTGYKMELFYKHVLRYEDGQGVFEWGAGGIMHLHSINVGSCMPRVDPTSAGMQRPDVTTAAIAARFADIHEEYLTDWSLGKNEKWTFHEVDAVPARFRQVGSPVHTDSESDGSEDLEESHCLDRCVRRTALPSCVDVGAASDVFGQHVVGDDVDFLRVFPTATTMSYVTHGTARATRVLTRTERETLLALNISLEDTAWHPCQISVAQKALLMTNNCRLVRRARRKWYRKLTEKCNMHDRHSGGGVEVPAVHIEDGEQEQEPDEVACVFADRETAVAQGVTVPLQVATLNMHVQSPGAWLFPIIHDYDVVCLQEVTAECLNELIAKGKEAGFHVVSPLQRGQVSAESFDVCLLLNMTSLDCVRVKISPLPWPSGRSLLQAHVLVRANGAILSVGTAHLTATASLSQQRQAELQFIFGTLEALKGLVGAIFAGDVNMRREEHLLQGLGKTIWEYSWDLLFFGYM